MGRIFTRERVRSLRELAAGVTFLAVFFFVAFAPGDFFDAATRFIAAIVVGYAAATHVQGNRYS